MAKREFDYINLTEIEPGNVYKALYTSYREWEDYSRWQNDWKQFDKDIHDFPDTIGSSGFATLFKKNITGFISWDPSNFPLYAIIGHNCVLPEYRNRGIGKHQVSSAVTRFMKYGFESAKVSTRRDPFFKYARKMYESCGFIECAPYRDDGENMIYYSIDLENISIPVNSGVNTGDF